MLVDVMYPGWMPFKNLAVSQDIPDWIKAQSIAVTPPPDKSGGFSLSRVGVATDQPGP
jgi:hypothetical protein